MATELSTLLHTLNRSLTRLRNMGDRAAPPPVLALELRILSDCARRLSESAGRAADNLTPRTREAKCQANAAESSTHN